MPMMYFPAQSCFCGYLHLCQRSRKNTTRRIHGNDWKYEFNFIVVKTIFQFLAAPVRKILFLPLENKFQRFLSVHGGYSSWSSWGVCSKPCDGGTKTRSRTCTSPPPAHGGRGCSKLGPASQTRECKTYKCPGKFFRSEYVIWQRGSW